MTEATVVRGRRRAVLGGVSEETYVKLAVVYHANKEMNASKKAHDGARADLLRTMKEQNLSTLSGSTELEDGTKIALAASVGTSVVVGVDVTKLKSLVSEENFLKIISATKGAVVEHAGNAVFINCETSNPGSENVTVKGVKA